MADDCQKYKVAMEGRMAAVETWIREMRENHMPYMNERLDEISHKLSSPRPSWFVALVFAAMSSAIVGFIVHGIQ